GKEGKQKLNQLTRYVSLVLAFIQALTLTIGISINYSDVYFVPSFTNVNQPVLFAYMAIVATAGTAFTLWLAELISKYGIGNGSSMIICAGIIASYPAMLKDLTSQFVSTEATRNIWVYASTLVVMLLIVVFIVFMESAKRTIPVQYANRPSSAQFRGKNDSNIPIKLNSASVIPVIFASTLMALPVTIVQMAGLTTNYDSATSQYKIGYWLNQIFSTTSTNDTNVTINIIGFTLYIVLIFLFSFFYTFLQMNPEDMADNLQKQNAFIPGVRPGEETVGYISRVIFKITMVGGTYLTFVAILPIVWSTIFDLPSSVRVGGTGLIIIVGVAMETAKQIKEAKQEREYKGFLDLE
ncbi:MAG: preprotein translocase subunit SecY, partial [Bacilli bacterium]